jgi:hypothetical protein
MALQLGQRFRMIADYGDKPVPKLMDGESIIAEYLPGLAYKVTQRNSKLAMQMVDDGLAELIDINEAQTSNLQSELGRTSGRITVKE